MAADNTGCYVCSKMLDEIRLGSAETANYFTPNAKDRYKPLEEVPVELR